MKSQLGDLTRAPSCGLRESPHGSPGERPHASCLSRPCPHALAAGHLLQGNTLPAALRPSVKRSGWSLPMQGVMDQRPLLPSSQSTLEN